KPIYYPPTVMRGRSPGGYDGAGYTAGIDRSSVGGVSDLPYTFISVPIDVPDTDTSFDITAGSIILHLKVAGVTVQTYTLDFPDGNGVPMPTSNMTQDALSAGTKPWFVGRFSYNLGPVNGDVLHGVESATGDARMIAAWKNVPADFFAPHENFGTSVSYAHGMRTLNNELNMHWIGGSAGAYVKGLTYYTPIDGWDTDKSYRSVKTTRQPKIPSRIEGLRDEGWSGDFDNGFGSFLDGPFINKPDEGMLRYRASGGGGGRPYGSALWVQANGFFSPLRQIPSAVMFGSLPSGAKAKIPWRTLLFCPNPADSGHKGFGDPADHLLLDLFRMPVVEPLALSGPASTDGKINMNYAIAPFSYIRRASSWYALLETLKVFAIPDGESASYKNTTNQHFRATLRWPVDIEETLSQFGTRFSANDIFRSPSEICSLFLVPEGETLSSVSNLSTGFWSTRRLTGDNSREHPYAELYPKLTTQSNVYRVHMRVQVLPPSEDAPGSGEDFKPLAEYRGSRLIERYLDPKDPRFKKFGGSVNPDEDNLNALYQFRTLEARQFNP
ncbi:MAG: Verru_Chthon cassette protein A, partial [Chthoniobacterales bacterium]